MKNFREIYEEVLIESKDKLEKLRKGCLYRILGGIGCAIVCGLIGIYLKNEMLCNISILLSVVVTSIMLIGPLSKYKSTYKEAVVKKFIELYNPNLKYFYNEGISSSTYRNAQFEGFDRYHTEDLIAGEIDGMYMKIAEVHTERRETYRDSDGHTRTRYVTIFHGLFGTCEINNTYGGVLKIRTDPGVFGRLFQGKKRIEMDSSEFEKYFEVKADDKIQAMQILTSDVMDLMVEFVKESKIGFEFTINHNEFYIRFRTGGMFEGSIFKSAVDFDVLKKVYDVINFTFDITKAIAKTINETQL